MKSDMKITVYIHDGLVTINIPKKGLLPDQATIHRIMEAIREERKKKSPAGEQTGEGQSQN